jgi:4-alpha-glucanotransferase
MASPTQRREAGVLVPLFALRSPRAWGIGEIGLLGEFCAWCAAAGHRLVQLLPVVEMAPGERSPYAAVTTFAVDPIYLSLPAVEDFVAAGGETALSADGREALAAARRSEGIDYDAVRRAKRAALVLAFRRFSGAEWSRGTPRAEAFRAFRTAEAGWLGGYAAYRTLQEAYPGRPWRSWPAPFAGGGDEAVRAARAAFADVCRFHEYVQWLAAGQWAEARRAAAACGVRLKGDLPFMVSGESADVWERPDEFRLDAHVGAPPDAFNAEGQDWGLPVPRWEAMAAGDFVWLRARAAHAAAHFDAVRLDHVVGLYRTYVIDADGSRAFTPGDEAAQLAHGERLLRVMLEAAAGTELMAEDLGDVPPWVRRSLTRLGIPGYRVLRWEVDGGVFRDPAVWPQRSVATTGTHDTSSLATWWEDELDAETRAALAAVPAFAALRGAGPRFTPSVHAMLLGGLYAAGSDLVVLPYPDTYGGRERINVPATVGPPNWGYRMPWTVERLREDAGRELAARLRGLASASGRDR